ncbi:MAG TPA: hypothetical protein VFZ32_14980 [Micromonosporaceae bacterium]
MDLIDSVLCLQPELRVVIFLGQESRRRGLSYPVERPEQLAELIGDSAFDLAGHRVDRKTMIRALAEQWFPLTHEGELLSVICLALHRCRAEAVEKRLDAIRDKKPPPNKTR